MANVRRLVLAKASHTRPNRRGRLAPPMAGSASRVAVSTNASVRPSLSSAKNSPTARSRLRRFGTGGPQGPCQSPPSVRAQNSAPTAVGACYARRWRVTPLASLARQPFRRARRITGACPLRGLRSNPPPSIHQDLRSWVDTLFTATRIECHLRFHAQFFNYPDINHVGPHARSSPSATPCASPNTNRNAVFNPSGTRRIRADLAPDGFNTAPSQRAGNRRSMSFALIR